MNKLIERILEELGLYRPMHSRIAIQSFSTSHPEWRVTGTKTLAREPHRFVVAIFYKEPINVSFPPSYLMYAVARDYSSVEELPDDPDSPYALRGRK